MQSRVKLLGSTALAAAALVMGASTASADGHKALEKRVKALEKAGGSSVTRSKKTMKLVVSGHINRAIVFADNGTESAFSHVTSNFSRTRVRWIGTGKINDDLSVKTHIELGHQSSIGTQQDIGDNGDFNPAATLDERHVEFQVTSKSLGKIYMGQGISGSESTSEQDLSGTGIISLNGNAELIGGGEVFQVNGAGIGITLGGEFTNLDGLGRRDRIRYDTPKFSGFQVTMSHGNEDAWDVALRYGGSFGGVKVKAAIAHWDTESINGNSGVNGSMSVLLPMGLSLTVGAAEQSDDRFGGRDDDTDWRYAKVGYRFKGSELGETRLFADYSQNNDAGTANAESTYWGFGVVQIIEPLGAELYAVYHNFELDLQNAQDPDDIGRFAMGARFKF
ncbi:MAG: porin [Rhodospirillaceae bacterium]|nr:porin [Rhodospirillaceae bacterium]